MGKQRGRGTRGAGSWRCTTPALKGVPAWCVGVLRQDRVQDFVIRIYGRQEAVWKSNTISIARQSQTETIEERPEYSTRNKQVI